ncbi:MAG: YqgE/AlgH family protein [Chitinivibrionales bacterium]|nr:YqgE/AlgH family protein [Chitinivibrionales bacterium]MBD3356046.1 YqgE/AlgH family protein [Chitinivibrionales bacterium]
MQGSAMELPFPLEQFDEAARKELAKLKNGCVLLSKQELEDPNFKSTVVLICVHNNEGAFGLVLNRPSHMPLSEVFDVEGPKKHTRRKIYIGGPVQQNTLHVLQLSDDASEHAVPIAEGVYLGGEWESLEEVLAAPEEDLRLFLGYSGWGSGQLETEILRGAWEVHNPDVRQVVSGSDEFLVGPIDKIRSRLEASDGRHENDDDQRCV